MSQKEGMMIRFWWLVGFVVFLLWCSALGGGPASAPRSETMAPVEMKERVTDGVPMMFVPAGEFLMGNSNAKEETNGKESPQHQVYLDAFWIDKFEVTSAQYKKCVDAGKCAAPEKSGSETRGAYFGNAQYDNYPVIYVSWNNAKTYCEWAGKRLPTEAQWEKAARGTDGRNFPWGNTFDQNLLNSDESKIGDTTAVGKFPNGASPYGVMDMAGNVFEWVADWYDRDYYQNSPARNPTGPATGDSRSYRGGSWFNDGSFARAAARFMNVPDFALFFLGFRCVE